MVADLHDLRADLGDDQNALGKAGPRGGWHTGRTRLKHDAPMI
jgi:hypothetical protein